MQCPMSNLGAPVRIPKGAQYKEGGYKCPNPLCRASWPGKMPRVVPEHSIHKVEVPVKPDVLTPPSEKLGTSHAEAATWIKGAIVINSGASERGSHQMSVFEWCPQLYSYMYVLKLPMFSQVNLYLARGSLVHVGMAHLYARKGAGQRGGFVYAGKRYKDPDAFHEWRDAMRYAIEQEEGEARRVYEGQRVLAEDMVRNAGRYIVAVDSRPVIGVETEYRTYIDGRWLYTQRVDVTMGTKTEVVFEDHKTATRLATFESDYEDDRQIVGLYRFGRANFGDAFKGVWLNGIGSVPPHRTRKVFLPYRPVFGLRFSDRIRDTETRIQEYLDTKRDPWAWPTGARCVEPKYKRRCAAWDICWRGRRSGAAPAMTESEGGDSILLEGV